MCKYLLPWKLILIHCLFRCVVVGIILDESASANLTSNSICVTGEILTAKVVYWESFPTPFSVVVKDCKKVFAWKLELFPDLARALQLTEVDNMFSS